MIGFQHIHSCNTHMNIIKKPVHDVCIEHDKLVSLSGEASILETLLLGNTQCWRE